MSALLSRHTGELGGARAWWDSTAPWSGAYPPNPDWRLPRVSGDDELSSDDELAADQIAELASALGYDDPEELAAELGFSIKKLIRKAGKAIKKVAPIVKAVGVVTAFVCPPAGIAITSAAAGADALVRAAEKGGKVAKTAQNVVKATKLLAAKGDVSAQAGLAVLARVATERRRANVPRGQAHPKLAGKKVQPAEKAKLLKTFTVEPTRDRGFFVTLEGKIQRRGI